MTKKKRSLFIVLGVVCVCVLSCAFVLTGCGNKHKFSSDDWTYDETGHWHACTKHDDCGETDGFEAHTPDYENGVVTTPATCGTDGVMTYTCTVCGYDKITETIPATGEHTLKTHVEAKDADCKTGTAGNIEYWQCSVCEKYFSDSEGKNEISLSETVITAAHTYSEKSVTDWTWTGDDTNGYTATVKVTCDECGTVSDPVTASVTSSTEGGVTTYTATATVGGVVFTDEKAVEASSGETKEPAVSSITLSSGTLDLTLEDTSVTGTVTATVVMDTEGATYTGELPTATSDNEAVTAVVTANTDGTYTITVTATAATTTVATVTVTAGGKSATLTVTVEEQKVVADSYTIVINEKPTTEGETIELIVDDEDKGTITLTATVTGATTGTVDNPAIVWSSSDNEVAIVEANTGVVTAVGAGTVTITATYTPKDGGTAVSDTVTITVDTTWVEDTIEERACAVPSSVGITVGNLKEDQYKFYNEADLDVEKTTDDEGNIVYVVSGTASIMTAEQALAWNGGNSEGAAKAGDAYVIIGIYSNVGETIDYGTEKDPWAKSEEHPDDDLAVVMRLGSFNPMTVKITYGEKYVTEFTVSFEGVVIPIAEDDAEACVVPSNAGIKLSGNSGNEYADVTFYNPDGLTMTGFTTIDGDVYSVYGEAGTMTSEQALAWNGGNENGSARECDAFVIVGLYSEVGQTIYYTMGGTTKSWTKTQKYAGADDDLAVVVRIDTFAPMYVTIKETVDGVEVTVSEFVIYFDGVEIPIAEDDMEACVVPSEAGIKLSGNSDNEYKDVEFNNPENLTMKAEITVDGIVYTVYGEAGVMDERHALAWNGGNPDGEAKEYDAFVIVGIYSQVGQTIYYTMGGSTKSWTKTQEYADADDDLAIVVRLTDITSVMTVKIVDEDGNIVSEFTISFAGVNLPEPVVTGIDVAEEDKNITLDLYDDSEKNVSIIITMSDGTTLETYEGNVTWTVSESGYITIDGTGTSVNIKAGTVTTDAITVTVTLTVDGKEFSVSFDVTVIDTTLSEGEESDAVIELDFTGSDFSESTLLTEGGETGDVALRYADTTETGFTVKGSKADYKTVGISSIELGSDSGSYRQALVFNGSATNEKNSLAYTLDAGTYKIVLSYFNTNTERYATVLDASGKEYVELVAEEDKTDGTYTVFTREIYITLTASSTIYIGSKDKGLYVTFIGIYKAESVPSYTVTGVALSDSTLEVKSGEEVEISAIVSLSDGTTTKTYKGYTDGAFAWTSSTVDTGTVTGLDSTKYSASFTGEEEGVVTVTVTIAGYTANCTVTVLPAETVIFETIVELDFDNGGFSTGVLVAADSGTSVELKYSNGESTGFTAMGSGTSSITKKTEIASQNGHTVLSFGGKATTTDSSVSYTLTEAGTYTVVMSYFNSKGNNGRYGVVLNSEGTEYGETVKDSEKTDNNQTLMSRSVTFTVGANTTIYIGSGNSGLYFTFIGIYKVVAPVEVTGEDYEDGVISLTLDAESKANTTLTVTVNTGDDDAYSGELTVEVGEAYKDVITVTGYDTGADGVYTLTISVESNEAIEAADITITAGDVGSVTITVTVTAYDETDVN